MFDHPLLPLTTCFVATAIVILVLPEMDERLAVGAAVTGVLTSLAMIAGNLMV
jgi:hypothetical protein